MVLLAAVAFVLGGLLVTGGGLLVFLALRPQVVQAQRDARAASDRLLSAWHQGVTLPPLDGPDAPRVVERLDPVVEDWLEQFDDHGRAHYGRKASELLRGGLDGATVVLTLDRARRSAAEHIQ